MKNPFTICEEIIQQIRNDADIKSSCQTNFGRELKFQIGFDANEEPGIEDTPFLVVTPFNFAPDRSRASRQMLFRICLGAKSETFKTETTKGYNYCPTIENFLELYEMIEKSISDWGNEKYINSHGITENSFDLSLPFIRVFFSYSVQEDY